MHLAAREFGCAPCRDRGLVRRFADALDGALRNTWCADCLELTELRWVRSREQSVRLRRVLERAFAVAPPASASAADCLVTG